MTAYNNSVMSTSTSTEAVESPFRLTDYDYELPAELIAQEPVSERDQSRLLMLPRSNKEIKHGRFDGIISLLESGDVLVVNDTKVFPARLLGHKETGGKVELFLLGYPAAGFSAKNQHDGPAGWQEVECCGLFKSSRPRPGMRLLFGDDMEATVLEVLSGGKVRAVLRFRGYLGALLDKYGRMPLPPYIQRDGAEAPVDRQRYQTVFASQPGAVAAPTAGLHFTPQLLERLQKKGVDIVHLTLHVGYGTFAPVRVDDIRQHKIHAEFAQVSSEAAARINEAKSKGHAVWPVGTTTVRTLEWATNQNGKVQPVAGWCDLYIYPGYKFRLVDRLITNFHLPKSSLLFLVSALAGRERVLAAYAEAVRQGYRFYSYGDAMAVIS